MQSLIKFWGEISPNVKAAIISGAAALIVTMINSTITFFGIYYTNRTTQLRDRESKSIEAELRRRAMLEDFYRQTFIDIQTKVGETHKSFIRRVFLLDFAGHDAAGPGAIARVRDEVEFHKLNGEIRQLLTELGALFTRINHKRLHDLMFFLHEKLIDLESSTLAAVEVVAKGNRENLLNMAAKFTTATNDVGVLAGGQIRALSNSSFLHAPTDIILSGENLEEFFNKDRKSSDMASSREQAADLL